MNTIRWTCNECDTVNIIVLGEGDVSLECRSCGTESGLQLAKEVTVTEIEEVMTTQ